MSALRIIAAACIVSAAGITAAAALQPANQPYTYTGTASVLSGSSSCLGAASPAAIAGDAVVENGSSGFLLHITSSNVTYAFAGQFKTYNGQSPVRYNNTETGAVSYLLLPSTVAYSGTFSSVTKKGSGGVTFTDAITLTSGPLIGSGTGSCTIGLTLSFKPGVNKALLKLLNGIL